MWISGSFVYEMMSSKAENCEQKELPSPLYHPDCLLGAKAVSPSGTTGVVIKVNAEARGEDRYDSIDIEWDKGGISRGVFLLYLEKKLFPKVFVSKENANKEMHFLVDENRLNRFKVN